MSAEAARVCVAAVRSCKAVSGERSEPQEGGALPRLGRGLCPRLSATATTTIYTLVLVCSSKGRESNLSVHNSAGECRV